ncbi:MAG TPA: glutaredoxin family protein [Dehalococcoidales bacterium]|nr:glutaredoxin family protein [Dehalococcoidales bacterium]
MAVTHVPGKKSKKIIVYALSTCPWCAKTKRLLNDMGVEYDFVDVDLETAAEKHGYIEKIKKWNPASSFPTIVIDDQKCIIGFKEYDIIEAVKS